MGGSFAKNDLRHKASYGSLQPCRSLVVQEKGK